MDAPFLAPLTGYKSKKAAQLAAYFVSKQPDIEKMKLIKLLYLSEREFVKRHGSPMLYDELYSMKDGPVCSSTLNGINGNIDKAYWSRFVELKNNRNVAQVAKINRASLDEVSDAEITVADVVWKEFGGMTSPQIRAWTHKNCPEYTEVGKGRVPISYGDMYRALGENDGGDLEERIRFERRVDSLFLG